MNKKFQSKFLQEAFIEVMADNVVGIFLQRGNFFE